MRKYEYHGLESFQSVFSRQRSWLLFAAVVLSFPAAPEMMGVMLNIYSALRKKDA
jgi:hypothetical protein